MSLRRFIVKRLLAIIPILFGVSIITFGLVHLTPGDPVQQILALNPRAGPAEKAQLREQFGLAAPVWEQYLNWITGVLTGDFGEVYKSKRAVSDVIYARLPETLL